jgi:hypothetical protein
VPGMPEQSNPVEPTARGKYEFEHVSATFAKELVADLAGLGEAFDKGEVTQFAFLQFCVTHLGKIDTYIANKSA